MKLGGAESERCGLGVTRGVTRDGLRIVRVTGAASLTQRGYVVDVHAEKNAIALGHGGLS